MQNINLYDPALRLARDWLAPGPVARAVGAALAAVVLASGLAHWRAERLDGPAREVEAALRAQQAAAQQLAREVDTLRPDAKLAGEVASAQATLEQRQAALRLLQAGGLGHPRGHAAALQAIARQSIDGLWLTGVVLERDDMALRGRALAPSLIPDYVGRLDREPALQGRAFRALEIRRPARPASGAAPARWAEHVEFALAGSAGAMVPRREDQR